VSRIFKKNDPKVIKAWTFYDWANSVYNLIISTAIFPLSYAAKTLEVSHKGVINGTNVDLVNFFWWELKSESLLAFIYSFSFLIVVILVLLLSGIADFSGSKKSFLKFFCYLGSISCMSLFFFDANNLEVSFIPLFFASIGFWGSLVFYNSFLLEIADKNQHDRISAQGFSRGYIGSVILLVTILVLNAKFKMPFEYGFLMVGIWWAGFAQYSYYYLPDKSHYAKKESKDGILWSGFREFKKVWKELRQHKKVKWFLGSYFTYNMGVQTVMLMAVTFAINEINWIDDSPNWWETKQTGLIASIIIIQLIAIVGAYFMSWKAKKWGNLNTLMLATIIWVICTVIAYLIHFPMQFYGLAVLVGFVMGGIQSLSRSTYSKMLPPTKDSASYFSFFDVTEKIGLIFGPLAFAILIEIFGNMRTSVLMLMVFFIVGFFLLLKTRSIEKKTEVQIA
jgi:UMF1 family MFS transporter